MQTRPAPPDSRPRPLARPGAVRHSPDVRLRDSARPTRTQYVLAAASALCYALGYPIALIGNNPWGWLLVTLGGVLLVALLVVTIRRIDRNR